MHYNYDDIKYWAELLDYSCAFDKDGRIYLSTAFEVKEFDSLEEATRFILPAFLQDQAV